MIGQSENQIVKHLSEFKYFNKPYYNILQCEFQLVFVGGIWLCGCLQDVYSVGK